MDPCRLDVFHDAHDVDILAITDRIDLGFLSPLEELVDEDLVVRHVLEYAQYMALEIMVIDYNLHALATEHIGRPDQYRIADLLGNAHCVIHVMSDTIFRIRDTQFLEAV